MRSKKKRKKESKIQKGQDTCTKFNIKEEIRLLKKHTKIKLYINKKKKSM